MNKMKMEGTSCVSVYIFIYSRSKNHFAGAAAFRPRAHTTTYTPTVEKGRPILQGLLAIDLLAKEVSCLCF